MRIEIYRDKNLHDRSLGQLFVTDHNGRFCFTLEDAVRGKDVKIYGKTAIPEGQYKGRITYSERFKRDMISIYNVSPGILEENGIRFEGIRIHGGNRPEDTEGCPLVAYNRNEDTIWSTAEKALTKHVKDRVGYKEFEVFIFNTPKK